MEKAGFDGTQLPHTFALGLLRILYAKALSMTDAVAHGGYVFFDDPLLNHYYIANITTINALLERPDFDEFKNATDFLPPTLVGNEEIDIEWEFGRKDAYEFLAQIDAVCLKNNVKNVSITPELQKVFDAADEALKRYSLSKKEMDDAFPEAVRAIAEEGKTPLVTKDNRGDFFYDGKRIEMDKAAIYYEVFDALYSRCDQSGFASYEDIEKCLVACGRLDAKDTAEQNKRINNAINKHQGLFRYAKVNGKPLKNKTPDGKELVAIVRGKGLKLNNTRI